MNDLFSLLKIVPNKTCKICGNPLKERKITIKEQKAGHAFVMENVPVLVCERCSETWLPDIFLQEFKKYIKLRGVKYGRKN